jgi:hypothetical protein
MYRTQIKRRLQAWGKGDGIMKSRRFAYWWFKMVVSGRFIENFFDWRKNRRDGKKQVAS